LRLLASRKRIKKTHAVRCVVNLSHDAAEISLDENVTRFRMHPADEFEAFKALAEDRGLTPEEIAARFGVSVAVVRQRLRLGAVHPEIVALYRAGDLSLEQVMAFAVSEDRDRQQQVLDQLDPTYRPVNVIRRAMLEAKVSAQDRRAEFIGADAYLEAGGTILRDLFTEDGGGWFEDAALLDRLVTEKLEAGAEDVRAAEGWKWAEARIDYPQTYGLLRIYPRAVERPEAERAEITALSEEYDALIAAHETDEEYPEAVAARLTEIDEALQAFGDGTAYDPEEVARAGVFVILGHDGEARLERGFVRAEDVPQPEPEPEAEEGRREPSGDRVPEIGPEDIEDAAQPLSDRLVAELTAYRTMGLRDRLAQNPAVALSAVVHALALGAFFTGYGRPSCLDLKTESAHLASQAPGIADSPGGRAVDERHAAWASRLPKEPADLWAFVAGLASADLLDLLAHCASLSVNALRLPYNRQPGAMAHADQLAEAVGLDMTAYWTVTADSYFTRVTKGGIAEAVTEAVSPDAAARIKAMKKPDMAAEAETLVAGRGWLPGLLRGPEPILADASPAPELDAEAV